MINGLTISPLFEPLFDLEEKRRYRQVYGGRGSAKSFTIALSAIEKTYRNEPRKILYLRQTMSSSEDSTYADVKLVMDMCSVSHHFAEKGGNFTNKSTGNQIIFKGIRATGSQSAKLKSLSGVTDLIIEEAEEVESFEEFSKVDESIRMIGVDLTVTLVYNPTSAAKSWIHTEWFIDGRPNSDRFHDTIYIHSTYLDNLHNLNPAIVRRYRDLERTNPIYYRNNILAEWTLEVENVCYEGWGNAPEFFDPSAETWYGLDFGYGGKDFTACVEINYVVTEFGVQYYIREVFCKASMSISDTVRELRRHNVPRHALIVADSAAPTLITEVRRGGFSGIKPCRKGPNSVDQGIKKVQDLEIIVIGDKSQNQNLRRKPRPWLSTSRSLRGRKTWLRQRPMCRRPGTPHT